jgi:hypothetical protein
LTAVVDEIDPCAREALETEATLITGCPSIQAPPRLRATEYGAVVRVQVSPSFTAPEVVKSFLSVRVPEYAFLFESAS